LTTSLAVPSPPFSFHCVDPFLLNLTRLFHNPGSPEYGATTVAPGVSAEKNGRESCCGRREHRRAASTPPRDATDPPCRCRRLLLVAGKPPPPPSISRPPRAHAWSQGERRSRSSPSERVRGRCHVGPCRAWPTWPPLSPFFLFSFIPPATWNPLLGRPTSSPTRPTNFPALFNSFEFLIFL
jgi:hypothetical protein